MKLAKSVGQWVATCDSCQRNKASTKKPVGLLQPLQIPEFKFQSIGWDFVTHLPETPNGNDAILVMVDRLTKLVRIVPCSTSVTAEGTAKLFYHNWHRFYGQPKEIVSDRDPRFTSNFMVEYMKLVRTSQSMSTAFHPETDGQVERMNRVIGEILRHYVGVKQTDWEELLTSVEFAINNSYQESIQCSPFELVYGQRVRTPMTLDATDGSTYQPSQSIPSANRMIEQMRQQLRRARDCILRAQDRQKAYADLKRRGFDEAEYAKGQKVLLDTRNLNLKTPGSRKLMARWAGPFKITEKIGSHAYRLDLEGTLKIHNVFHVSLIKPYKEGGRRQPPPPPVMVEDSLEFEVDEILAHRDVRFGPTSRKFKREYLVSFTGYGPEYNLWLGESECENCPERIQRYWEENPPTGQDTRRKRASTTRATRAKKARR